MISQSTNHFRRRNIPATSPSTPAVNNARGGLFRSPCSSRGFKSRNSCSNFAVNAQEAVADCIPASCADSASFSLNMMTFLSASIGRNGSFRQDLGVAVEKGNIRAKSEVPDCSLENCQNRPVFRDIRFNRGRRRVVVARFEAACLNVVSSDGLNVDQCDWLMNATGLINSTGIRRRCRHR